MTGRIIVLGGAGQLGRAAAQAFQGAGWRVASLARGSSAAGALPGTEIVEVDARDAASVVAAASGADVVLHALNVAYTEWERFAVPFAETAIAAARENRATLVFPGNLYNFGAGMPAWIDETAAPHPTSRMRASMATRIAPLREVGCGAAVSSIQAGMPAPKL